MWRAYSASRPTTAALATVYAATKGRCSDRLSSSRKNTHSARPTSAYCTGCTRRTRPPERVSVSATAAKVSSTNSRPYLMARSLSV